MTTLYDKNGIPIERGDILKVFHFIGARRKRHYMYKQAIGTALMGKAKPETFMKFSHLSMNDNEYYWEMCDGQRLETYEVVQSIDCKHEERERLPASTQVAAGV